MKIGIMQPYFLPYIGYFQLISAVDKFVVYDNIKYTKKGWINRNRILLNGSDSVFSLPLKKDSDSRYVVQRELAADFARAKLLNKFIGAYMRAPQFDRVYPWLEQIVLFDEVNLFRYIYQSIVKLCKNLGIKTEIIISSDIAIDHELKGQEKVLALCKSLGCATYINAVGGIELYSKDDFRQHGIDLRFIKANHIEYDQFGAPFVPWLSIVDVLMFNSQDRVYSFISKNYELV